MPDCKALKQHLKMQINLIQTIKNICTDITSPRHFLKKKKNRKEDIKIRN